MNIFKLAKSSMAFALVICIVGCSHNQSKLASKAAQLEAFDQEERNLFASYMTGDVRQAEQSLKQDIQQLKTSTVLDAHSQSGRLCLDYFRLYALEKRTGRIADAKNALMMAQFWRSRNLELSYATNDADIIWFLSLTPEQILTNVDALDAGDNGSRPKYLLYLTNASAKTPIKP